MLVEMRGAGKIVNPAGGGPALDGFSKEAKRSKGARVDTSKQHLLDKIAVWVVFACMVAALATGGCRKGSAPAGGPASKVAGAGATGETKLAHFRLEVIQEVNLGSDISHPDRVIVGPIFEREFYITPGESAFSGDEDVAALYFDNLTLFNDRAEATLVGFQTGRVDFDHANGTYLGPESHLGCAWSKSGEKFIFPISSPGGPGGEPFMVYSPPGATEHATKVAYQAVLPAWQAESGKGCMFVGFGAPETDRIWYFYRARFTLLSIDTREQVLRQLNASKKASFLRYAPEVKQEIDREYRRIVATRPVGTMPTSKPGSIYALTGNPKLPNSLGANNISIPNRVSFLYPRGWDMLSREPIAHEIAAHGPTPNATVPSLEMAGFETTQGWEMLNVALRGYDCVITVAHHPGPLPAAANDPRKAAALVGEWYARTGATVHDVRAELSKIGDKKGISVCAVITWPHQKTKLKQWNFITSSSGRAICITYSATLSDFEKFRLVFTESIESLKVSD